MSRGTLEFARPLGVHGHINQRSSCARVRQKSPARDATVTEHAWVQGQGEVGGRWRMRKSTPKHANSRRGSFSKSVRVCSVL